MANDVLRRMSFPLQSMRKMPLHLAHATTRYPGQVVPLMDRVGCNANS